MSTLSGFRVVRARIARKGALEPPSFTGHSALLKTLSLRLPYLKQIDRNGCDDCDNREGRYNHKDRNRF